MSDSKDMMDGPSFVDNACICLDWDDTLLCSTWLAQNGLRLDSDTSPSAAVAKDLLKLEEAVCKLLRRAKQHTHRVLIVTNAEHGWVELSAARWLPGVVPLLEDIEVFSARTAYEPHSPDPSSWKLHAFEEKVTAYLSHLSEADHKMVLSFGDSIHERTALHRVAAKIPNLAPKSIKFVERPTVEQLTRQVDLVHSCIDDLVSHSGALDLMLTISLLYAQ